MSQKLLISFHPHLFYTVSTIVTSLFCVQTCKVRPREYLAQGHSWQGLVPGFKLGWSDSRAILLSLCLWMPGISLVKHTYRHAWYLHTRVPFPVLWQQFLSWLLLVCLPGDHEQIWGSLEIRLICSTGTYSAPGGDWHCSRCWGSRTDEMIEIIFWWNTMVLDC